MLYLAIGLVLSGILILLYAIFFRSDERRDTVIHQAQRREAPRAVPAYEDSGERRQQAPGWQEPAAGSGEPGFVPFSGDGGAAAPATVHSERTAVLYEDSSSVIDYSTAAGSIDPSLAEYRKIRRIGKGKLLVENGGINFYIDKKFYRFDFHKIHEIKTGDNYCALFMKGSETIKLFVFLKRSDFIAAVDRQYRDFLKGLG